MAVVFARNVTVATLTPFLPDPAKATGAAVIVAPGGGFSTLSMENEGWDVARALAEKGVAAFVLKYRLNQTPADMHEFEESMRADVLRPAPAAAPRPDAMMAADLAPQIADARAAFALVRQRAAEWHIDPDRDRHGRLFRRRDAHAGDDTDGQDAKPAFIGMIYGPLAPVDGAGGCAAAVRCARRRRSFFGNGGFGLIESWRAAKRPVEFHLLRTGRARLRHVPEETTSTGWFDAFARWLKMHGMVK